jgi:hypothetical protein
MIDHLPALFKTSPQGNASMQVGFPVGKMADDSHVIINNHVRIIIYTHPSDQLSTQFRVVGFEVEPSRLTALNSQI